MRIILQLLIADGTMVASPPDTPRRVGPALETSGQIPNDQIWIGKALPSLVNFVFSVCWQALVSRTVASDPPDPSSAWRRSLQAPGWQRSTLLRCAACGYSAMVRSGRRAWSSGGVIDPWSVQRTVVPSASRSSMEYARRFLRSHRPATSAVRSPGVRRVANHADFGANPDVARIHEFSRSRQTAFIFGHGVDIAFRLNPRKPPVRRQRATRQCRAVP